MLQKKRVVCFGRHGQLAQALLGSCPDFIDLESLDRHEIQAYQQHFIHMFADNNPDIIVNCSAFTDVEGAESDERAFEINEILVASLGEACAELGVPLLHVSTDYVFDGGKQSGYRDTDATSPINRYGLSKQRGEQALLQTEKLSGRIIRTSWLYSAVGRNFLKTMIQRFQEHGCARVVNDQHGAPTSAEGLAKAIWALVLHQLETPSPMKVLHWTDLGQATWYEFACSIAELGFESGLFQARPTVEPVTSEMFKTKAKRPRYSVLIPSAEFDELGVSRQSWQDALATVIAACAQRKKPHE